MKGIVRVCAAATLLAAAAFVAPAHGQGAAPGAAVAPAPSAVPAGSANLKIGGHWTGAKLRCQKEVGKLVRCGTPSPFEITFADDGTGTTPDDNLPKEFTWRPVAEKEIALAPKGGGDETKLFGVEHEESDILTFQAYVYLPTADPNAPAETRYIHYVFDVNRTD